MADVDVDFVDDSDIEYGSVDKSNHEDDELEKVHFRRILNAFHYYRTHSLSRIKKTEDYLKRLPSSHQVLLERYSGHLENARVCVEHNFEIIKLIIKDVSYIFENADHTQDATILKSTQPATSMDMEKVQSTLKQFVRDWSSEGAEERNSCYGPILSELEERFPECKRDRSSISILVPGAGLGRLAFEIAKRGFTCQGNEFSLFMLFASNFVLNRCHGLDLYRLYPWVHHNCNNITSADQTRYITFPDVDPSDIPPDSHFSMAAGDFLEVFVETDTWDCVATCFFIDTGNNIVNYIETIWNILKPGGFWINIGPLLYHFADIPNENSIEPSYEDVMYIVKKVGFTVLKEKLNVPTRYAQNANSMLQYEYRSAFFVCQKTTNQSRYAKSDSNGSR